MPKRKRKRDCVVEVPTGYVAAVRQEILDHNIVYEYRYTLVLDTLAQIRKEAYKQRLKSGLPDYNITTVSRDDTPARPVIDCVCNVMLFRHCVVRACVPDHL